MAATICESASLIELDTSIASDGRMYELLEEAIRTDNSVQLCKILHNLTPDKQYQLLVMDPRGSGTNLLQLAAIEDHLTVMQELLSHMAPNNKIKLLTHPGQKCLTVLECAILGNHPSMVGLILDNLCPNEVEILLGVRPSSQTVLHLASNKGFIDVLEVIIQRIKPDVIKKLLSSKNSNGLTPMELAPKKCQSEVQRIFIENLKHQSTTAKKKPGSSLHDKPPIKPPTVLIFYQTNISIPELERTNADVEETDLLAAFQTLGIHPLVNRDNTSQEILQFITETRSNQKHSAIIVFVMGHGEEGLVFERDMNPLDLQEIVKLLSCDELNKTPKALITQSCRGRISPLKPVLRPARGEWDAEVPQTARCCRGPITLVSPNWVVIQSTLNGFSARRNFFIKELAKRISDCSSKPSEWYEIFVAVNEAMEQDIELDQTCEFNSTMRGSFTLSKF